MTNHKIKDYHKNRLAFEVIVKNYEMLCSMLIVLNKEYPKTFYPKKCRQWIDDLQTTAKLPTSGTRTVYMPIKCSGRARIAA